MSTKETYGRIDSGQYYFWGGPLSLGWCYPFEWKEKHFKCAWQALAYEKSLALNPSLSDNILKDNFSEHARDFYFKMDTNDNIMAWQKEKEEVVAIEILNLISVQHPHFAEQLLDTDPLELIYCGAEDYLSIGLPYWHKSANHMDNWKGDNKYGKWLMSVRENLKK